MLHSSIAAMISPIGSSYLYKVCPQWSRSLEPLPLRFPVSPHHRFRPPLLSVLGFALFSHFSSCAIVWCSCSPIHAPIPAFTASTVPSALILSYCIWIWILRSYSGEISQPVSLLNVLLGAKYCWNGTSPSVVCSTTRYCWYVRCYSQRVVNTNFWCFPRLGCDHRIPILQSYN